MTAASVSVGRTGALSAALTASGAAQSVVSLAGENAPQPSASILTVIGSASLLSAGAPALLLFPFSLIGIALLLPTLVQYIVCFLINTPVQARILDPFAQSEKREVAS